MAEKPRQIDEPIGESRVGDKYKGSRTWQEAMENKQEVYTAKEIFDLIQTNEQPKLDADSMRAALLERGMKEEDVNLALELMACIGAVNFLAFGKRDVLLEFRTKKGSNQDLLAGYNRAEEKQPESFLVYVKDLFKDVSEQLAQKFYSLRNVNNENRPNKTKEELFLGVAVHEVRHRLQKQSGFKMFSIDEISSEKDETIRKVLTYTRNLFEEEEKRFRKENRGEKVVRNRISPEEFDASATEYLAHNKLHEGMNLENFMLLVRSQPEK